MAQHSKIPSKQIKKYQNFLHNLHLLCTSSEVDSVTLTGLVRKHKLSTRVRMGVVSLGIVSLTSIKDSKAKSIRWTSSAPSENTAIELGLWIRRTSKDQREKQKNKISTQEPSFDFKSKISTSTDDQKSKTRGIQTNDEIEGKGLISFGEDEEVEISKKESTPNKSIILEGEEVKSENDISSYSDKPNLSEPTNKPYKKFSFFWGLISFEKG